ncbi:MAG: HIT family protein [Desulfurella sp.]|uniref:Diadenosine tetraphosphate (Ap4A) hydrolase n=2 Tax=Desulfurella TaxID=33001 RepID=A0A1G6QDA7_9BACT|nr:HIT family protein [Desulfurella multipotens]PMP68964.1 MAG: HIT family protein [Desulfurella multipotens]SDC89647.1 Diadenosine tetraphosphate (Ap4A) hydrolase [Desulfurella multipotens]
MKECLFCKIYEQKSDVLFENDKFFVILDKFPVNPGHMLIIPIKHIESIEDLSDNDFFYLKKAISKSKEFIEKNDLKDLYENLSPINEKSLDFIENALKSSYISKKPDGYNFGLNEGQAAGQTISHLHFHLIPRYFNDVPNPTGGIRYVIYDKANYKS